MKSIFSKINIFSKIKTLFWIIITIKNWQLWLAFYFNLSDRDKERMFILRNGQKFLVADDEFFPFKEVLGDKSYIKYCDEILMNTEAVIIDLGASIGLFSILVAKSNKNAKIYAYEPAPPSFLRLIKNIKINGFTKCIRAFNLGVAGETGIKKLFFEPERRIGGSFTNGANVKKSVKIKALTLKDVFEDNQIEKCDFLKIDVEGAEYEILFSTPTSYLHRIKAMGLEYHQGFKELKEFLEENGFSVIVRPDPRYSNLGILYAKLVI